MLFKPSQLSPDSVAIDATQAQIFTFQNNGDAQTDIQFKVYLNSTSAMVYDSTKITTSQSQFTLPANSLTNNNDYKYQITVFSGANSVISDFIFLKTYATPTISMTVPATISTRSYTFTASYAQAQNVPYQKYKFILYDNLNNVILDSDWQYSYSISYYFEGFLSGSQYKVECQVSASYSLTATTGKVSFSVSYTPPDPVSYLTLKPNDNTGGIGLSWSPLVQVTGVVTGTSSYVTGKFGQGIQINSGSKVTFNKTVPVSFTINCWIKVASNFTGDFLTLGNDEVKIGFNGTRYYVNTGTDIMYGSLRALPSSFFKLALKQNKLIIVADEYTEII